jgi:cytochrome b6-f complex iron-sulfur subunit
MAKISELTGEAREARIAELKQKMKEASVRAQAAHAAGQPLTLSGSRAAVAEAEPIAAAELEAEEIQAAPVATPVAQTATEAVAENGAAITKPLPAATPTAPKAPPKPKTEEVTVPVLTPQEMNRREFLTYAWGAALGVLGLVGGVASFQFLYPRFRAGEFGGTFDIPLAQLPDPSAAPQPFTAGKFWLVTTEDGSPKAIYMVCTHLGCLYKWEPSNVRFECPCHGSKFSHDGFYIEGPAPRSLDYFDVTQEGDVLVVDTGSKNVGAPSAESPARAVPV